MKNIIHRKSVQKIKDLRNEQTKQVQARKLLYTNTIKPNGTSLPCQN